MKNARKSPKKRFFSICVMLITFEENVVESLERSRFINNEINLTELLDG
jgi:hypothetical protein